MNPMIVNSSSDHSFQRSMITPSTCSNVACNSVEGGTDGLHDLRPLLLAQATRTSNPGRTLSLMNAPMPPITGSNLAPIDSLSSSNPICAFFRPPAEVLAAASPAPLNVLRALSRVSSSDRLLPSASSVAIPSLDSPPIEPSCAFARAWVTVPRSLPVPAEISVARARRSWAFAVSPVAVARVERAGRSSSSAMAAVFERASM